MMDPLLRAMLLRWLESGDEHQKRHAAARLNMPDAIGHVHPDGKPIEPPPAPDPPRSPLIPVAASIRVVRLGLRSCLYSTHEGCGCAGAHCHHLGRVVTLPDCLDCLPASTRTAAGP